MKESNIFLTAEWRNLIILNYEVDPTLLKPYLPLGVELDAWQGKTYLSVVGFLFKNLNIFGVQVPFHQCFEEVNIRFYVRREEGTEQRRGVVFIKEIVPKRLIATGARIFYNENYITLPMSHSYKEEITSETNGITVAYSWNIKGVENYISIVANGEPKPLHEGSLQEFITEHYWGYVSRRDGSTFEYQVEHPRWRIRDVQQASLHYEGEKVYGSTIGTIISRPPSSAIFVEGSEIVLYHGAKC